MANNAAKNINSLESHTMVPTATILGRVILVVFEGVAAVVVTGRLFPIYSENMISEPLGRVWAQVRLITGSILKSREGMAKFTVQTSHWHQFILARLSIHEHTSNFDIF
jgi:hypothetical protein